MSISAKWLQDLKINCLDNLHKWLMDEIGFESYLQNKLWDDANLLRYMIEIDGNKLYYKYLDEQEKVHHIDFSKK